MGRLLDFLFIAIFILYIIRVLGRFLMNSLFQSVVNKAQEQQNNQQHNYNQQSKPDNKVRIDHIPEKPKNRVPDSEGDFIDYEEIK